MDKQVPLLLPCLLNGRKRAGPHACFISPPVKWPNRLPVCQNKHSMFPFPVGLYLCETNMIKLNVPGTE